jgi:hypothetical protein
MSLLAKDDGACPCYLDPTSSACGVWDSNESACGCAQDGLHGWLPS